MRFCEYFDTASSRVFTCTGRHAARHDYHRHDACRHRPCRHGAAAGRAVGGRKGDVAHAARHTCVPCERPPPHTSTSTMKIFALHTRLEAHSGTHSTRVGASVSIVRSCHVHLRRPTPPAPRCTTTLTIILR
eukprot:5965634-Prymnesium_polylepis.2